MLENRLKKNHRKLKGMLKTYSTNAYRLYNKDIPEYPYIIDIYNDLAVVYEKGIDIIDSDFEEKRKDNKLTILAAIESLLGIPGSMVSFIERSRQKGKNQYETLYKIPVNTVATENNAQFVIKTGQYLDCGLFLDHRNLRKIVAAKSSGKRILNLYCYTGSFSIHALLNDALFVTNIDLSKTYLKWFEENAHINNISPESYENIQTDVMQWLTTHSPDKDELFDIIILDPPTFSNSKRMDGTLDIQRDHSTLMRACMKWLSPNGELYFSNNKNKFALDSGLKDEFSIKEITKKTTPMDFTRSIPHKSYLITHT